MSSTDPPPSTTENPPNQAVLQPTTTTTTTHTNVRPPHPLGVPAKFSPEGVVQPFPGNTILCHLRRPGPTDSGGDPLHAALTALYTRLAKHPFATAAGPGAGVPLYALLPPPSWHVTLFEGVCDRVRDGKGGGGGRGVYWPAALPPDATLADCTEHFIEQLESFELGEDAVPPYRLRVVGFSPLVTGIGLALEGATSEEDTRIRRLRDRLAELLGIRHPGHETYGLHVSIAYLLRHLSAEQEQELTAVLEGFLPGRSGMVSEFELGTPPELCLFENMFEFQRLFYLGEAEGKEQRNLAGGVGVQKDGPALDT